MAKSLCFFRFAKYLNELIEQPPIKADIINYLSSTVNGLNHNNSIRYEIIFPYF